MTVSRFNIPEYYYLNYGVTPIHFPHNLQITGLMELPFGANKPFAQSGGCRQGPRGLASKRDLQRHQGKLL